MVDPGKKCNAFRITVWLRVKKYVQFGSLLFMNSSVMIWSANLKSLPGQSEKYRFYEILEEFANIFEERTNSCLKYIYLWPRKIVLVVLWSNVACAIDLHSDFNNRFITSSPSVLTKNIFSRHMSSECTSITVHKQDTTLYERAVWLVFLLQLKYNQSIIFCTWPYERWNHMQQHRHSSTTIKLSGC